MFRIFLFCMFALCGVARAQSCNFDPVGMTEHISHGDLERMCADTVMWIVEKPGDRWVSYDVSSRRAGKRFRRMSGLEQLTLVEYYHTDCFFVVGRECSVGRCLHRYRLVVDERCRIVSIEVILCHDYDI